MNKNTIEYLNYVFSFNFLKKGKLFIENLLYLWLLLLIKNFKKIFHDKTGKNQLFSFCIVYAIDYFFYACKKKPPIIGIQQPLCHFLKIFYVSYDAQQRIHTILS